MYPNPYGNNQYPPQNAPFGSGLPQNAPFGSGLPQQPAPFGSGYPQQPAPFGAGYPQPGAYPPMQQQGMLGAYPPQQPPQGYPPQGMPMPTASMPSAYPPMQQAQQPGAMPPQPFNYQSPPGAAIPGAAYPPTSGNAYPPNVPSQQIPPPQNQYQNYGAPPPQQSPVHQPPIQQQMYHQQQQSAPVRANQGRPTVHPAPNFDPSADCAALRKAMKGFGTDEDAIINVLCRRTSHQRVEIVRLFKTSYGKSLIDDIKSESSGNFQKVLLALLKPLPELYAFEIYNALSGAGTDECALIEVMCMLSNAEIRAISYTYYQIFGRSLEEQLRGDTSGHFKRLLTSLSVGNRDESMITDVNSAQADAQVLKRAGVDKWGTDESEFHRVLCTKNYNQIRLIAQEYEKLTGKSLEKDIKSEFSGDIEDGLLAILRTAINRPESFAIRLHKSMAGLGTDDSALIRLVVSRAEIDMEDIKEAFLRKYGKTLKSFIKGDTSGHYKHALYALIGENRS